MKTTTQTYMVSVTTEDQMFTFYKTMPTRPTTSKGIKAQNNRVLKWAQKTYPNQIRYEVEALK